MSSTTIDEEQVEAFLGQIVVDAGAAMNSLLVYVGDRLGLWRELQQQGATTPGALAGATGTNERMVTEWLSSQAASGYITYDPADKSFQLPPAHGLALADEDSPAAVAGFFQVVASAYRVVDDLVEAMRTGHGLGWGDQHPELFGGVERFFRPTYDAYLTSDWIPLLDGVEERLRAAGRVADVGCGHGVTSLLLAAAYPGSEVHGFDPHVPSIEQARRRAVSQGRDSQVSFQVASAHDFPGSDYDLVTFFDSLHDMADPKEAADHALSVLRASGAVLLVEPLAHDRLEDNLNPVGRVYYSGSTVFCTPASLDDDGAALGAQAGEERLRSIFLDAGFSSVERVAETPFNMVLQARP
jgi:SAM-dependent methyltransferase